VSLRRTASLGALVAALLALTAPLGYDYGWDAGPAVRALAHGDFHGYLATHPQMGPVSLFLRAPLEALIGPGSLWGYRAGALACLLGLVALAGLMAKRMPRDLVLGATLLLVANPAVIEALRLGHPENTLLAAFSVAAVLLAPRRPMLAAALLGGAIATKQTGLIAVVPVALAAPEGTRKRVLAVAAGLTGLAYLPWFLLDPHAAVTALHNPAFGVSTLRTGNIWGPFAQASAFDVDGTATAHAVPSIMRALAHPIIAVLTVVVPALVARRRRLEPLALLALLQLVRCGLDPWDHGYYHVKLLTALVAWETIVARRKPYVSLLSAFWIGVVFSTPEIGLSDLLYVAWAIPLGVWLLRLAAPRPERRPAPLATARLAALAARVL
jgi:hypothetical protein